MMQMPTRTTLLIFVGASLGLTPLSAQVDGTSKVKSPQELKHQSEALSALLKDNSDVVKAIQTIFNAAYEAESFDGGKEGTRNGQVKDGIITLEEVRQHVRSLSSYVEGDEDGKMYRLKEVLPDGDPDPKKLNLKLGVQNSFKKLEEAHPELLTSIKTTPALQGLVQSCQERTRSANITLLDAIQQDLLDGTRTALAQNRNRQPTVELNVLTPKAVVKHARELTGYLR
jgi:hypothetical protein